MRVELLGVGWISSSAAVWRQGEDPQRRIRFPVPAYLIETDDERILVDTAPPDIRMSAERQGAQQSVTTDGAGRFQIGIVL